MLVYAAVKLVAYCVWCFLGARLFAPHRATVSSAVQYGSIRWLLGVGFGVLAGISLGSISPESVASLYVRVYVPLRIVEWTILAALLLGWPSSSSVPIGSPRVWLWVAGGIALSFATDLASPEGMAGRFCVGRCLC